MVPKAERNRRPEKRPENARVPRAHQRKKSPGPGRMTGGVPNSEASAAGRDVSRDVPRSEDFVMARKLRRCK